MDEQTKLIASTLDKTIICNHLRMDPEFVDETEWRLIDSMRRSAIEYVCDHCAVDEEYVDAHEDLAIAVLILVSDMYDQRGRYVDSAHVNRTVECILSHHDRNFVAREVDGCSQETTTSLSS